MYDQIMIIISIVTPILFVIWNLIYWKKSKKYFDETYINQIKKELGYGNDTANLFVYNNALNFRRIRKLGAAKAIADLTAYNLSFEENGLLFIQRSKKTLNY